MYFVLITAKHTTKELEAIVNKVLEENPHYVTMMNDLYKTFKWFEIDCATECQMYAVVDDKILEKLAVVYNNLGIIWTFEDKTNITLYYDRDNVMKNEAFPEKLRKLMYDFITENTDVNFVLEKISQLGGSEHLNDYDKEILKSLSAN